MQTGLTVQVLHEFVASGQWLVAREVKFPFLPPNHLPLATYPITLPTPFSALFWSDALRVVQAHLNPC